MTSTIKKVDVKDFATRVERMCDFFIAQRLMHTGRDGSSDLKVLEDLKEDAANIQFMGYSGMFEGLSEYMNGITVPPKEL